MELGVNDSDSILPSIRAILRPSISPSLVLDAGGAFRLVAPASSSDQLAGSYLVRLTQGKNASILLGGPHRLGAFVATGSLPPGTYTVEVAESGDSKPQFINSGVLSVSPHPECMEINATSSNLLTARVMPWEVILVMLGRTSMYVDGVPCLNLSVDEVGLGLGCHHAGTELEHHHVVVRIDNQIICNQVVNAYLPTSRVKVLAGAAYPVIFNAGAPSYASHFSCIAKLLLESGQSRECSGRHDGLWQC